MPSWSAFTVAEPELSARSLAILTSTTNAVLGTLRRDGSPRLSGIDPFLFDGDLWIGSMPGARKGDDLRRDPRLALHAIPWESRQVREGAVDPGAGDVKLTGRGVLVTDDAARARVMAGFEAQRGFEAEPGGEAPADLFAIDLATVVAVSVDGDQLVIDRWSATEGRKTVRRS